MARMPGGAGRTRSLPKRVEPLLAPGSAVALGGAAGFFCFAMPPRIAVPLLHALGLPPAAGAQGASAIAAAILAGAGTWGFFRLLDRPARVPARPLALMGDAAPVLRRADAHPDAPPRRPIFAGSDLGAPPDPVDPPPAVRGGDAAETPAASPVADGTEDAPPAVMEVDEEARAPLGELMDRLETGLARKEPARDGDASGATPPKREIKPIGGSLGDALETLSQRTTRR